MRALATWAAIMLLALWMAVGLAVVLLWLVPTWALSTLINRGLVRQ